MRLKKRLYIILTSFSIELKIYGMVFAVIMIITVISWYVVQLAISDSLTIQLHEKATSIASDVAARSEDLLLTQNIHALQRLVTDTKLNYHDIEYVFIMDTNGKILVDTFENSGQNTALILANNVSTVGNKYSSQIKEFNTEKGVIIDIAAPIFEEHLGTVRIGQRYESLNETLKRVSTQMILTMIGVLFFSILIVLGLTKIITSPISQLVDLTNEVSKGNLIRRIKKYPNDEIGKLTKSFNEMLDNLQRTERAKEKYYHQILNRNKELSLLNKLSGYVTSIKEMRQQLDYFVSYLAKELSLNSVILNVKIQSDLEVFQHSLKTCPNNCNKALECPSLNIKNNIIHTFPLYIKNDRIGEINICSNFKLERHLISIIESISNQLSVTIENLRLWQELKKKEEIRQKLLEKVMNVQEEERKRIARELHDETSHSLSSILLGLKLLKNTKNEYEKKAQIEKLREIASATIEEVHDLAWQLRPSVLDKFGLNVAIERHVEEFKQKTSIDCELMINICPNVRLKPEIETTIFRIVQESLTNITKYAHTSFASVIILKNENQISIVIEDDGVGFDVEKVLKQDPAKQNLGLYGMLERVSLLGGTLNIESTINEGTAVLVKLPLK